MYETFYQLKRKPFQITTDPAFLWLGEKHREALATLKYGVMDNKGFLLLTGDVGTGKTTLIHALLESLDACVLTAMISDPSLSRLDFYRLICNHFGVTGEIKNKSDFLAHFSQYLYQAHEDNRTVLLIIDETQRLKHDLLEEIRLLSNIEKAEAKLLNIFFVGQNEVNTLLLHPENRALRKRITITYRLEPLNLPETMAYIAHRLKMAGAEHNVFSSGAMAAIYGFSDGAPRQINIICDLAMLYGYEAGKRTIGKSIVERCLERISFPEERQPAVRSPVPRVKRSPAAPIPASARGAAATNSVLKWAVVTMTGLMVVVTAALFIPLHFGGEEAADSNPRQQTSKSPANPNAPAVLSSMTPLPEETPLGQQRHVKVTATLAAPEAPPSPQETTTDSLEGNIPVSEAAPVKESTDAMTTAPEATRSQPTPSSSAIPLPAPSRTAASVPPATAAHEMPLYPTSSASQKRHDIKPQIVPETIPEPDPADIVVWLLEKKKAAQSAGAAKDDRAP
ncbi:ExeA2 [Desulfosarcina cetonica]|uniref:AAA family ATPase n=1 Tax=Desulfosarcina cetonica TaxID=90730 RepID=UPI0006D218ED|nr:AAA family ATPase [Desulfosarcina cetonica]VTR69009.1 ExeA2 [Desulfosarcina cetonica]